MDTSTKNKLKKILYEAFKGSWELGGGAEFRYKHGLEVADFSMKIAYIENLEVDKGVMYVAGLFHDIGKVSAVNKGGQIEYESEANKNHEKVSFEFLKKYIANVVSDDIIKKAAGIINEELNESSSIERKIIKDADELGNFGYSQVWRTFNFIALNRQTYEQMLEFWESGNMDDRKKWIDQLHFTVSKRVALKRYEKFADFIKEIKRESLGEDIV